MRVRAQSGNLRVLAIAGTRCVLIAIDLPEDEAKGLQGFAIARKRDSGRLRYLKGKKVFRTIVPQPDPKAEFPSNEHPIQSFLWSTYTADPGTRYGFTVEALYGTPGQLAARYSVSFGLRTEPEDSGLHRVWFNRGAVASQAFAEEFGNTRLTPEQRADITNRETKWLSRGLIEACLAFINETAAGEALRVAAYEFTYAPVLDALKAALDRGVDVRIVYGADKDNDAAIAAAAIPKSKGRRQILFARTRAKIPHNKFFVRIVGGKPAAVWTGSTNFTPSGFLGQTNVGHVITDGTVARAYLDYWEILKGDPARTEARTAVMNLTPDPATVVDAGLPVRVFSPRTTAAMRQWYGQRIRNARNCVLFTGAFGIDPVLLEALAMPRPAVRFILLEKPPSQETRAAVARNRGDILISHGAVLGKMKGRDAKGKPTDKLAPIPNFAP